MVVDLRVAGSALGNACLKTNEVSFCEAKTNEDGGLVFKFKCVSYTYSIPAHLCVCTLNCQCTGASGRLFSRPIWRMVS